MTRLRGLKDLVVDAVDHGSRAVEELHAQTGRWVFDVLERVAPLAAPARLVRSLQQQAIARAYGTIRLVNRLAGEVADMAIDLASREVTPPAWRPPRAPRPRAPGGSG